MIHLITLNPAIDEYIYLNDFQIGKTSYRTDTKKVMGGKAVNVANVLQSLKLGATLVTTIDNSNKFVSDNLMNYNAFLIDVDNIRTNLKINDNGHITEINDRGSALSSIAKLEFENYVMKCVEPGDIVLIAGNPHFEDEQFQFRLALLARDRGAKLCLDSNRFDYQMICELKPFFIKPNDEELELLLADNHSLADLTAVCDNIIVSHGSNGFTYYNNETELHERPITGNPINTVGAGDSLVAGYIYAIANNFDLKDCLALAKYSASATVYSGSLATYNTIKQYDQTNII